MATERKDEFHLIVPEEALSSDIKLGTDVSIPCRLSPEISAVDMEIKWFKETDCVYLYMEEQMIAGRGYKGRVKLNNEMEKGKVSLELKNIRKSDVGVYLCQVTSGDRKEEIAVKLSLYAHEDTEILKQTIEKTAREQTDKEKMEKSALIAVFSEWKDTNDHLKEKEEQMKQLEAKLLQTVETPVEGNTQLENMHKPAKELESSKFKLDNAETKTTTLKEQQMNIEEVKVFTLFTGNANVLHKIQKNFIGTLRNQRLNLREVGTVEESDVILIFCPIVSRVGTDIDAALKIFKDNTGPKPTVLVVLHRTFDPEKMVPDSSRCVNRTDILTVDFLFHEDTGLLKCQKNSDATDKVENWLILQWRKADAKISPHQNPVQEQDQVKSHKSKKDEGESELVKAKRQKIEIYKPKGLKVFSILAGKTNNCDQEFIAILGNQIKSLREVCTVDESDIILLFCPIVSRTQTDIEAALNKLKGFADSEQALNKKPTVLVVLHRTFDPEKMVPDSSRCVNRTDILTVDFLFHEDTGLLTCQKNSDATDKAVNWLILQGKKMGVNKCRRRSCCCLCQ